MSGARALPASRRCLAVLVVAAVAVACSPESPSTSVARPAAKPSDRPPPKALLATPAAFTESGFSLHDGPVDVPLEFRLPTLGIRAPVSGVGATPEHVMDAPMGPAGDPVWQQVFWYRGSAVPGELSTAIIAGHVNGPKGSSAIFARLDELRPGDPVVVRDTRTGLDVRFAVTASKIYSLAEATDPAVLAEIYGTGPVAGKAPEPSADGLAHLSLITCTGTFVNGTHDHRLVVYATRSG